MYRFYYDRCWVCSIVRRHGVRVRFLEWRSAGDDSSEVIEVWAKNKDDLEKAVSDLKYFDHVTSYKVDYTSERNNTAIVELKFRGEACPSYSLFEFANGSTGASPVRVDYTGSLWCMAEVRSMRKTRRSVEALEKRFGIERISVKIFRRRQAQFFLLKEAYERGYFDVPRRISLSELAKEMQVPKATLSINLRRAVRNILEQATR